MNATAQAKRERETFNGRTTYARFREYCNTKHVEPTEEALATWDRRFNDSLIKKFWGDDYIYSTGLRELYRRFLNTYTITWKPNPKVKGIRITARRVVGPERKKGFLDNVTTSQIQYIRDELKQKLKTILAVDKFFSLGRQTILGYVNEALDEIEAEAA